MSDDDWDDLPETSMDDEAYDKYVKSTFGAGGGLKGDPPVALLIWVLVGLVLVAAVFLLT